MNFTYLLKWVNRANSYCNVCRKVTLLSEKKTIAPPTVRKAFEFYSGC